MWLPRMVTGIPASEHAPQQSMTQKVRWHLGFVYSYAPLVKEISLHESIHYGKCW